MGGIITSLGVCQGGMQHGAALRVARRAQGGYGPCVRVSTQLEQHATQDSEEDLQAMGSLLALPLSLQQRPRPTQDATFYYRSPVLQLPLLTTEEPHLAFYTLLCSPSLHHL